MYHSDASQHNPYSVFAFLKEMNFASVVISRTHLGIYCQGLDMSTYELPTSPNSFIAHFGITSLELYASALNHVFGQ